MNQCRCSHIIEKSMIPAALIYDEICEFFLQNTSISVRARVKLTTLPNNGNNININAQKQQQEEER